MKPRILQEIRELLAGTGALCSTLGTELTAVRDLTPAQEVELAEGAELAIGRLRAVTSLLRGRQEDRERVERAPAEDDEDEEVEGDEWKRSRRE